MQETEPGIFTVAAGEVITIAVTPIGVGVFVAASLDGNTLSPSSGAGTAPVYKFTANGPGTVHMVAMEFDFPQANKGSRYDVSISGDRGGSAGFAIGDDDAVKDPFLQFTVTN